ncbi:hypothetical protein GCM10018777_34520 [Streptomyces albogriseolus]|uniref:hypothetical protein n=1 Tax=Streptomyces albogriseolus TaxID=1887 RepID=UPI0019A84B00|nr:hypothetical protein [Streptomyces viridodiastaticus]GHG17490.1 hypothetical protein GCM10018777_34520 [Streptomyces viridodiastaticus]
MRAEARAESRAEDILLILEQRGLDISEDVRSRVTHCTNPELLRRWLARAVTVPTSPPVTPAPGATWDTRTRRPPGKLCGS